jgi:GT2 family glycosyltransferase
MVTTASHVGLGVVVIGRNEGDRLRRCLQTMALAPERVVYVDSGSTDDSVAFARSSGHDVVALDMVQPFTAARARNAGLARLRQAHAEAAYVQFVDGDCELHPEWLRTAAAFLGAHPEVVGVCGRLRERHPSASVYNQLCDLEWDTPVGEARMCGGIAMFRIAAVAAAGGFDETLIAGEEPELCVRLRARGGRIWRLDADMGWHDAAMTRFAQWWRRMRRSGHAFAQGAAMHGKPPERHFVAETRRAVLWGLLLPLLAVGGVCVHPAFLLLLLAFPLQVARLSWRHRRQQQPAPVARAFFLVLGRVPEAIGVLTYGWRRWFRAPARLIEYK